MAAGADLRAGRLGIIAGYGFLPRFVAEAARRAGENPYIISLANEADQDWTGFDSETLGVGDMVGVARALRQYQIGRVVMSGGVRRRPSLSKIRPTLRTLAGLPGIVRTLAGGGDDAVLRMVIKLIEAQGDHIRVIGVQDIAPDLLATTGPLGKIQPSDDDRRDIAQAAAAAEALGRLDVGQGAVSVGGRIVALEGVEGTDRMLARVAELRAEGRISQRRKGVLVKLCKPQQDVRADLPAVGVSTVLNARAAGLAGIAVDAGRALVIEREKMLAAADEAGLFVCGIDRGLKDYGL